jgi:hypothetical protein
MSTRDIVLIGTGAVVGFFLMGYFNKLKQNTQGTIGGHLPIIDQAKLDACTKSAEDTMKVVRLSGDVDLEAYKQQLIADCMKAGI